jgi:uncharacterized protein (DUF4415 family)
MAAAEKLFRPAAKAPPAPPSRGPVAAAARETVTIRIDRDVLDHFQADGPGWQERINVALREASGLSGRGEPGKRPEELNATNDD